MKILSVILLIGLFTTASGQSTPNREDKRDVAVKSIRTLADGILVVVLPTRRKAIETLTNKIEKFKAEGKAYSRTKALLSEIESERDNTQKGLIAGFSNEYNLGKVLFLADSNLVKFTHGGRNGLLDKDKNLVSFDGESGLIVVKISETTSDLSYENFSFSTARGMLIPSPFPNHMRVNDFGSLFSKRGEVENTLSKRIKRLSAKLERFYQKHK